MKNIKGILNIKSITADGEISERYDCNIFKKNGETFIFYSESDDTLSADVGSTLKLRGDRVELVRSGSYGGNMVFCEGMEYSFLYNTPYGKIEMSVFSKKVRISDDVVELVYDLKNGSDISENTMQITIERI